MKINFNQPKYLLPMILLPFICFFFWIYSLMAGEPEAEGKEVPGMQNQIGNASPEVQKKAFDDKLDAFSEQFKHADGNSAVNPISEKQYNLDSIDVLMKQRFGGAPPAGGNLPHASGMTPAQQGMGRLAGQDQALTDALAQLKNSGSVAGGYRPETYGGYSPGYVAPAAEVPALKEKDPMEIFKAQMKYMDSVSKAADPEYQAEQKRQAAMDKAEALRKSTPKLSVQKDVTYSGVFNTVKPGRTDNFITAVIDENMTGYAGSRIRLRLLEDIRAGKTLVRKGTYLYALISGFGDQRVTLSVRSILQDGKILPVKLDLYDTDGLAGLYVPESAFREFTKDLGGGSMQGVNIQGNSTDANQFLMSSLDKMFQSTSSAIASLIRKNKAKIKYNSYIYLIDTEELQNAQQDY